jgi:hypothetical protein
MYTIISIDICSKYTYYKFMYEEVRTHVPSSNNNNDNNNKK